MLSTSVGAAAQSKNINSEITRRVQVTLVSTNHLPPGTSDVAIVRRVTPHNRDYILLSDKANANQLSAALFTLMAVREQTGDTAKVDATINVNGNHVPVTWQGRVTASNARTLERLRHAPVRAINGIGVAPAYDVYLLPHVLAGKMHPGAAKAPTD
jgi:hypothetical protein